MKIGKPKSKRKPVRLRHKIEKKSAAKQRKDRKTARNDPTWRSRLKKDPGIPNLFPYKAKLLEQIEESKRRKEEDTVRRREQARSQREGHAEAGPQNHSTALHAVDEEEDALLDLEDEEIDNDTNMNQDESANPMAALLASARARAADFDPVNASDGEEMDEDASDADSSTSFIFDNSKPVKKDVSHRAYAQTVNNLIATSDILLYVLDARDPHSTRSSNVEQTILANPDKRLILILNKIDLIPADVLKGWLLHLRSFLPTLPLRSASSAPSAKQFDHKHLTAASTATNLIRALKTYSVSRASTTVGIIGYPNVGKSSVINALTSRLSGRGQHSKSKKECPIGAEAGVTTTLREVKLDNKIKLIDSPGVVFPISSKGEAISKLALPLSNGQNPNSHGSSTDEHARLVLLNALPPREIADPVPAVSLLLQRFASNADLMARLLAVYGVPALMSSGPHNDVTTDFLLQVARKRGRLGKGGVPNLHAAAFAVVGDWRDGRIQGWVDAPVATEAPKAYGIKSTNMVNGTGRQMDTKIIVKEWAREFKIEGLWGDDVADDDGEGPAGSGLTGDDTAMALA